MATPVGAQDGGIAAENALNGKGGRKVNHGVIPRAIFTDPQVGVVGLSDEEATAQGYECACRIVPMSLVPRAAAVRDTRGIIKMVADRTTKKVLGVSMHGMEAAEVIHEAAMGLHFGAMIDDFARMLHVYPTMAEALKIAALSYTKEVWKMSCCAD
jgi:mercuric reductase